MIAIVDPVLDAVLSKKLKNEKDINICIVNVLFDLAFSYSADDSKQLMKNIQDTLLQLFLTYDYISIFDLDFHRLTIMTTKIKSYVQDNYGDFDFAQKLLKAIRKRTKVSVSDKS